MSVENGASFQLQQLEAILLTMITEKAVTAGTLKNACALG